MGIETLGGVFTRLIDRNTTVPTRKSQTFSTAEDNQQAVTIRVFQGERQMASDNKLLGQFDLMGIPPAPRGVPQIEVTFDIDANSIVNVSAKDKATGKEQQVRIESGGLSDEDIDKMVKDAEVHEEEDKKKKEFIDIKNQADSLIHTTEKSLSDHGDKIEEEERLNIESSIKSLKDAIDSENSEDIKTKTDELMKTSMKLGQAAYEAEQSSKAETDSSAESPDVQKDEGPEVVDAEFEEVEDNEKK